MTNVYLDQKSRLASSKLAAESGLPPINNKKLPTWNSTHLTPLYNTNKSKSSRVSTQFQPPALPPTSTTSRSRRPSIPNPSSSQRSTSQQPFHRPSTSKKRALPPVDISYDDVSSQHSNYPRIPHHHEVDLQPNYNSHHLDSFCTPHVSKPLHEIRHIALQSAQSASYTNTSQQHSKTRTSSSSSSYPRKFQRLSLQSNHHNDNNVTHNHYENDNDELAASFNHNSIALDSDHANSNKHIPSRATQTNLSFLLNPNVFDSLPILPLQPEHQSRLPHNLPKTKPINSSHSSHVITSATSPSTTTPIFSTENDGFKTPPPNSKKRLPPLPPPPNFKLDRHINTSSQFSSDDSQYNDSNGTAIAIRTSNPNLTLSTNNTLSNEFIDTTHLIQLEQLRHGCIDKLSGKPISISYGLKRAINNEFTTIPIHPSASSFDTASNMNTTNPVNSHHDDDDNQYGLAIYNGDERAQQLYCSMWSSNSTSFSSDDSDNFDPPIPLPLPPRPIQHFDQLDSMFFNNNNQLNQNDHQSPPLTLLPIHPPPYQLYQMEYNATQYTNNIGQIYHHHLEDEYDTPTLSTLQLIKPPIEPFLALSKSSPTHKIITVDADKDVVPTSSPTAAIHQSNELLSGISFPRLQSAHTPMSDHQTLGFAVQLSKELYQNTTTTYKANLDTLVREQSIVSHPNNHNHSLVSINNKKAVTIRLKQYLVLFISQTHPLFREKYLNPGYHFFRVNPSLKQFSQLWKTRLFTTQELHQICLEATTHVLQDVHLTAKSIHETITHHFSYNE